jgi:hypothetical protein
MGVEIDGAMQQAAHAGRRSMGGDCARAIAAMRRLDWTSPMGASKKRMRTNPIVELK